MVLNIKADSLSLKYGKTQALDNISLELGPGKIYGLLGRNGAGKTSLLSLIAAFNRPTSGKVEISGEDPFENQKIISQVSFNYNSDYSDENETASDFFEFASRYRPNFDPEYARDLAGRLFKIPLDKKISQLSQGMQSALDVTIGLASKTPITLFDEIHLGMDAAIREKFYQELIRYREEEQNLIILSTHLVSEMGYLFDHVLMLDQGKMIIDQPYDQVIEKGNSITGRGDLVDNFIQDLNVINIKKLGPTKSAMVYGQLNPTRKKEAEELGLEIGPVSLQELFIHLTDDERGEQNADQ